MALANHGHPQRIDIVELANQLRQLQEVHHFAFRVLKAPLGGPFSALLSTERRRRHHVAARGKLHRHLTPGGRDPLSSAVVQDDCRIDLIRFLFVFFVSHRRTCKEARDAQVA